MEGQGDLHGVIGNQALAVPRGYVSGAQLSSSSTYEGVAFANLGMAIGTYTWTWGQGAAADSITLIIVDPTPTQQASRGKIKSVFR